jgi:hypothetical protein
MQGQNMRAEVSGVAPETLGFSGRTAAEGDTGNDGGAGVDHEGAWAREEQEVRTGIGCTE